MAPGIESSSSNNSENIETSSVESTVETSSEVSDNIEATDFESIESDAIESVGEQDVESYENVEATDFEDIETESFEDINSEQVESVEIADFESTEDSNENSTMETSTENVESIDAEDFENQNDDEYVEPTQIENSKTEMLSQNEIDAVEGVEATDFSQETQENQSDDEIVAADFESMVDESNPEETATEVDESNPEETITEVDESNPEETTTEVDESNPEENSVGGDNKNLQDITENENTAEDKSEEVTQDDDFSHWLNPKNYDENGKYTGDYRPGGMDASSYVQKIEEEGRQNYREFLERRTDISQQEKNELYSDYIEKTTQGEKQEEISVVSERTDESIQPSENEEKSSYDRLYDYMSRHNYGPDDFCEYSQDPEWRTLQKEAFPDYELPPMESTETYEDDLETNEIELTPSESHEKYTELEEQQELIYQKLEEPKEVYVKADDIFEVSYVEDNPNFWNEKTHSKEEYIEVASKLPEVKKLLDEGKTVEELSADEEWSDCINAYYSDRHPIEVMQYDNAYIYQSDGRHRIMAAKEVGCEIPVKVTCEAKEKAVVKEELAKDFEKMGISYEGIDDIPLEKSIEIKDAIEEMRKEYPEVKELLSSVEITDELEDGTFAAAGPRVIENQFTAKILVNKNEFNDTLERRLASYKEKGFFAGNGNKGVIKHEVGHILQLKLDAESANLSGGEYITGEINRQKYNDMIDKWNSNEHTDVILDNALDNLSLSRKDVANELSKYGATNSAEALAEAISEVNTSSKPRRLAVEIVKEYAKLKQEMEGKRC